MSFHCLNAAGRVSLLSYLAAIGVRTTIAEELQRGMETSAYLGSVQERVRADRARKEYRKCVNEEDLGAEATGLKPHSSQAEFPN